MDQVSAAALLFLLSCFLGTISGLLSKDFSECNQFFYQKKPPKGLGEEYQRICQKYKNDFHFATMYNRDHRLAIYSAYIVNVAKIEHEESWMFEPQLNDEAGESAMQPLLLEHTFENQATLRDYDGSVYTKGHLAPKQHQATKDAKEATYTLTNIVPQRGDSNSGPWSDLEAKVSQRKKFCVGDMYVITGAIPFDPKDNTPPNLKKMNNKVYAPEYMWSAYCCSTLTEGLKDKDKHLFPTYAAVGRNYPDSEDDIVPKNSKLGYDVKEMPLQDLEAILEKKLNKQITLFHEHCHAQ